MDLLTYAALKKKLSGGGSTIPSDLENKVNKNTSDISSLKSGLEQQNNKINGLSAAIKNLDGTDVTQMAADNTEYRASTLTSLTITLPADISDTYESSIVFTSGSTPTNGIFPDNIKWTGTGVVENNGAVALVPVREFPEFCVNTKMVV